MTLNGSFAVVVYGLLGVAFVSWYIWCLWTMFFRCHKPMHFFASCHSISELFVMVNVAFIIVGAAYSLHWLTN